MKSRIVNTSNEFSVREFSERFPFLSERLSCVLTAFSCDDKVVVSFNGARYDVSFRRQIDMK